jgi:AcrR family transcriptional regulator
MMPGNDWLASKRGEMAAERILDAAGELFARQPAASVTMNEIAEAAGCSRATLYRYFENRQALYTAYVHREAYALYVRLMERLAGIDDPHERLVTCIVTSLELVRSSSALHSWFVLGADSAPIGAEFAEHSDLVNAMSTGFVVSLSPTDDTAGIERKARWLLRILISLLIFPGRDADDERAMLEEFLVPVVARRSNHATQ